MKESSFWKESIVIQNKIHSNKTRTVPFDILPHLDNSLVERNLHVMFFFPLSLALNLESKVQLLKMLE